MDNIRAVEFTSKQLHSVRRTADMTHAQRWIAQPRGVKVTALVLPQEHCDRLLTAIPGGDFADRGLKKRAIPLARYVRGRSGIVAVRASYTNAGQATRGIRAMIATRDAERGRTVCLIAVSARLFEELWQRAEPDAAVPSSSTAEATQDVDFILAQIPETPGSRKLREVYLGSSKEAEAVRRQIVQAATVDYPVLIQGETGTGKEVVARMIHDLSPRKTQNLMPVNCGGISTELLESELFGHVKGSFAGAYRDKKGFWELAKDSTLFLDEVGDLSLRHQVKILRALDSGSFTPVGAEGEVRSNARIIAATNRDLGHMVEAGQFREDLYYRLFTLRIRTPALREHPDDIPALADHFWQKVAGDHCPPLPLEVTDRLKTYPWPGNARELRAFLINVFLVAAQRPVNLPIIEGVLRDRLGMPPQTAKPPPRTESEDL